MQKKIDLMEKIVSEMNEEVEKEARELSGHVDESENAKLEQEIASLE